MIRAQNTFPSVKNTRFQSGWEGKCIHVYGGDEKSKEQLHCPVHIFTGVFPRSPNPSLHCAAPPGFTQHYSLNYKLLLSKVLPPPSILLKLPASNSGCLCQSPPPQISRWALTAQGVTHKYQWGSRVRREGGERGCVSRSLQAWFLPTQPFRYRLQAGR